MTVPSTTYRNDYTGTAGTLVFPYTFRILADTEIVVTAQYETGDPVVLTNYTVDGVGSQTGGNITFSVAPFDTATLESLTFTRSASDTQNFDIRNQTSVPRAALEDALDRRTMVSLKQQEEIDRSIKFPVTDTGVSATLPPAAQRALKTMAFDASGNAIVGEAPTGGIVSTAMTPVVQAATVAAGRIAMGASGVSVSVKDYPFLAKGDGVTDDTAAIQAAALSVQNAGGGTLLFPPGKYIIFSATTGTLCSFSGLNGIACLGYGATLEVLTSKTITASEGYMFFFSDCKNILVDGFTTNGPVLNITSTTVKGYEFVRCVNGCRNIFLPNNRVVNSLSGFICSKLVGDADSKRCQNIHIGTLDIEHCWYGINGQWSGDFLKCDNLRTNGVHRSCFFYGSSNQYITIWSKDHVSKDVSMTTAQGIAMENVTINYHSGVDSFACGNAAKVVIGFSGNTASLLRNVRVNLDVAYKASGSTGGAALLIYKANDAGGADTVDRGHYMRDVTITGTITGAASYAGDGSRSLGTDVNCTWGGGDYFSNIRLENLTVNGSAGSAPIFVMGGLVDSMYLRNVNSSHAIFVSQTNADTRLPHTGQVVLENVKCTNRFAYDVTDSAMPLDNVRGVGGATDTVRLGWSGKTISNIGNGGAIAWALPAATVGLKYRFIRQDAQILDIDPNGSEIIRGGTAGQILRLNTAGNVAQIECLIAGAWEITSLQGAVSYV